MTITIYLIRLLVSLIFGFSTIICIAFIFAVTCNSWNGENVIEVILGNIVLAAIWLGSGYLLWVIK